MLQKKPSLADKLGLPAKLAVYKRNSLRTKLYSKKPEVKVIKKVVKKIKGK